MPGLAGLLRHGLLRGSFIPEKYVRQWRDLSRLLRREEDAGEGQGRSFRNLPPASSVISSCFTRPARCLPIICLSPKRMIPSGWAR